ncbi:MAG TPA: GNAT family N-acetyltransferase [Bdellovibrionota bacterium]|jgi:GNAT superfamily N-acetyltransferase
MVSRISTDDCMPLRSKVLRPFHPLEDCRYPLDGEAVHFGAFHDTALVSIVTAHPEDHELFPAKGQWRIRGMATEPSLQSSGFGSKVLLALLEWGKSERLPMFWCNGREAAIPFYLRHGFTVESELFDIKGIGAHKVLKRLL